MGRAVGGEVTTLTDRRARPPSSSSSAEETHWVGVDPSGRKPAVPRTGAPPPDILRIPDGLHRIDFGALHRASGAVEELRAVLGRLPEYSTLRYGLSASDTVLRLLTHTVPKALGNAETQILTPMNRGSLGANALNQQVQNAVNPLREGLRQLKMGDRSFRVGDRVIQRRNNYNLNVFNGDIGQITAVDPTAVAVEVTYRDNVVAYERDDIRELGLAYAITIHKSQGSEFDAVIIPIVTQHYTMLFRNLIYTATRAATDNSHRSVMMLNVKPSGPSLDSS